MASKTPDTALHIALTTHPDAAKGPSALQHALGLVITDKASHESVRTFGKEIKEKMRDIEAYYRTKANGTGIIEPLYKAYKAALATMEAHLKPYQEADKIIQRIDTEYVREQRRIEEETARLERERLEREEQARRDKEAAAAEAAALKLEASSTVLSAREQVLIESLTRVTGTISPNDWYRAARGAGYKNPEQAVERLIESEKMQTALVNAIKAKRIREEAAAAAAKPLIVEPPKVESQIGSVSGTRTVTYYSCESFDTKLALRHLAERYEHGDPMLKAEIERYIGPALQTLLNAQARQLKTMFAQVWPGAKLGTRDGVAG